MRFVRTTTLRSGSAVSWGSPSALPDKRLFSTVPNSNKELHGQEVSPDSGKDLYREISRLCHDGRPDKAEEMARNKDRDVVTTAVYNLILGAYAATGSTNLVKSLLERMRNDNSYPSPDTVSFNTYLSVLPPHDADKLLKLMIKKGHVDAWSFNTVISGWAKVGDPNRAVSVLKLMSRYSQAQDASVAPDKISFSTVLSVFGRMGMAKEASLLLERMKHLKPDTVAVSSVITAWANSGRPEAPQEAIKLVDFMKRRYDNEQDYRIKPDTVSLNAAMAAMANTGDHGPAAEALLRRMKDEYDCDPNVVSYATVLAAWKNSLAYPEAADRSESLLFEMVYSSHLSPNTICFATVLSTMAKHGLAERAEALLQRMEHLKRNRMAKNIQLNSFVFSSLMEAWAESKKENSYEVSLKLIERMEQLARDGNADAAPNLVTFNTLIKVIEKCVGVVDKATRARGVLNKMKQSNFHPNTRTFNAIILACGACDVEQADEALNAIERTLQELRDDSRVLVDSYTYPAVLKACERFKGSPRSRELVETAFQCCREDQWVDGLVLKFLKRATTEDHLNKLLGRHDGLNCSIRQLPRSWGRKSRRTKAKSKR